MRRQKEPKSKKFMVYFIGIIMVVSVFGVIFFGYGDTANRVTYNGYKFFNKGNSWTTTINNNEAAFAYLPNDIEFIEIEDMVINRLKNAVEIDITYDFNDTNAQEIALAQFQMSMALNSINIFIRNGFTSEQENFAKITCEDSTNFVPVIYFKTSNVTDVYLENNCVIAKSANSFDILRIKDRLTYGILGIIE